MKHAPRLQPNLQVLCFRDTLTQAELSRLPAVIPYSWTLEKVQRIAKPSKKVIPFAPIAQEIAA